MMPGNPDMESHTYTIGGVQIHFPHKAYSAQVAIMDKVIRGCNSNRNCLIESPTGSGKTLALLCSALAWQKIQKDKVRRENEQVQQDYSERIAAAEQKQLELANQVGQAAASAVKVPTENNVPAEGESKYFSDGKEVESEFDLDEDADVFKSPKKKKVKIASPSGSTASFEEQSFNHTNGVPEGDSVYVGGSATVTIQNLCNDDIAVPKPKYSRPPKIYFGTRTHKQIEQIIHELKKTSYKDVRMTILSSREHTCINATDTEFFGRRKQKQYRNKTELCKELLDPKQGMGCMYKVNVDKINAHRKLEEDGFPLLWDIEELVNYGKRRKACPYFAARDIAVTADIIFCPYNYLIHPLIRKSMEINLHGEVMILDEAHNIEDVCRDSASLTVHLNDLTNFMQECEKAAESGNLPVEHNQMRSFIKLMVDWINNNCSKVEHKDDFSTGFAVWNGSQILASFELMGITQSEFEKFQMSANEVDKPIDPKEVNPSHISVSATSKSIYDGLSETMPYIFSENTRNFFRVLLDRKMDSNYSNDYEEPEADSGGWVGRGTQRDKSFTTGWKYSLNICCLHPAVAFKHLSDNLRSVILTSGTLSPIESFQSELGTEFPIRLEAAHVIDRSQVWIGALGSGPTNISLESTYSKTAAYDFQDELGRVILEVCKKVPYGVLCFLSSYTLLEKLMNRWRSTGALDDMRKHKYVLEEPRQMNKLQSVMDEFYSYVEECGALFFAVFRGKVSEGINFSDNFARCVISVGIPYPNAKDNLVKLKKDFNNEFRRTNSDILTGDKWYQIQAYRALNQALGRCIRHKNDWGAILLIDQRFSRKPNIEGLSKWIKNMIGYYPEWNMMIQSISRFTDTQVRRTSNGAEPILVD